LAENNPIDLDVLERWAMETAAQIVPMLDGMDRLRVALALIQARATECRHSSGRFAMAEKGTMFDSRQLSMAFGDRSEILEKFSNKVAERWLAQESKPMVELQ